MAVRNLRHGTLVIQDSGAANSITVALEQGNLEFEYNEEASTILDRGALAEFTQGPDVACPVSFTIWFEEWEGKSSTGAAESVVDALLQQGNASAWVSTGSSGPYVVDLVFTLADVEASGGQNEVLTFSDFHCDRVRFAEGEDGNSLEIEGKALVKQPSSVRT